MAPAEEAAPAAASDAPAAASDAPGTSADAGSSSGPAETGAPAAAAVEAEAPKATIGADEVTQTWEERSRERKLELQALREKEKATLGAVQRRDAKERLAYLMKQTDVFAHFIKPDEAASP